MNLIDLFTDVLPIFSALLSLIASIITLVFTKRINKKKDDVNIIQRNIGIGNNMFFCYEKNVRVTLRQKRYINEIFPIRVRVDTPRTIPDLEERGVGPPMDKCISYLC